MIIKNKSAYLTPGEIKSIRITEIDKNFNLKTIYKNIDFVKIIKKEYQKSISLENIRETILKETKKKSNTFTISVSLFGIRENLYMGAEGEYSEVF